MEDTQQAARSRDPLSRLRGAPLALSNLSGFPSPKYPRTITSTCALPTQATAPEDPNGQTHLDGS